MRNLNWLPRNTRLEVKRKDAGVDGEGGECQKKKSGIQTIKPELLTSRAWRSHLLLTRGFVFAENTIAKKKLHRGEAQLPHVGGKAAGGGGGEGEGRRAGGGR